MAEDKEGGFKISDRRKFNPDGTPRDTPDEAPTVETPAGAPAPSEAPPADNQAAPEAEEPEAPAAQDNVVSFPVEGAKKRETPEAKPVAAASAERQPAESAGAKAERSQASSAAERAYDQASKREPSRLPPATFLTLVNMLGVEAAMHLGLMEHPAGGAVNVDLEAAKHLVDLLGVLQKKTAGNLTSEEDQLLDNVLADLRMQFVAASRKR